MVMEWKDFRLTYYNLKASQSANALASNEVANIWIPYIVFKNTQDSEATL